MAPEEKERDEDEVLDPDSHCQEINQRDRIGWGMYYKSSQPERCGNHAQVEEFHEFE